MTEPIDRAAIKARAEAATPGPWEAAKGATPDGKYLTTTKAEKEEFLRLAINNDDAELWLIDNADVIPAVTGDGPSAQANAEFIAHAREDIPALLAALEEAERDLAGYGTRGALAYEREERMGNLRLKIEALKERNMWRARAEDAERRIAAVEAAKHIRWVCEVYESGYHNGCRCNADDPHLGRWNCGERFYYDNREIDAALHPVAETTESENSNE